MTNQSLQIHLKPITVLPVGFVIKLTARYVTLSDRSYVPQFVYASEILALVKTLSITDNYSFWEKGNDRLRKGNLRTVEHVSVPRIFIKIDHDFLDVFLVSSFYPVACPFL